MNRSTYKKTQVITAMFVASIVALAVTRNSFLLASAGVLTGIFTMILARSASKIKTDERELVVQEKAARLTYAIFAPTIGLAAFFLLLPSKGRFTVFSKGEWLYIESIGMIFAYLTLFLITIYAIFYHFFNRKLGGGGEK